MFLPSTSEVRTADRTASRGPSLRSGLRPAFPVGGKPPLRAGRRGARRRWRRRRGPGCSRLRRCAAGRSASPSAGLAVDCRVSGRSAALVTTRVNSTRGNLSEVREIPLLEHLDLYLSIVSGLGDQLRVEGAAAPTAGPPSPAMAGLFTVLPALERHLGSGSYRFPSSALSARWRSGPVGPREGAATDHRRAQRACGGLW